MDVTTQIKNLSLNFEGARVYYDTIVFRCNRTPKIDGVLKQYFAFGRIQSFRQQKDDTYCDQVEIPINDFISETYIKENEKWNPLEVHYNKDGSATYYDPETGEVKQEGGGFYETRGFSQFYKFAPSSNYDMIVRYIYQRSQIKHLNKEGYVEFEFSIAKFVYGHNLLLYPLEGDENGKGLQIFIEKFFLLLFEENYKKCNVVIRRLDCCFNYKFANERNFDMFLKAMKFYFEDNKSKCFVKYKDETFMYKTDAYSIKFYDKHKEFMTKGDYNKLYKYFVNQGKPFVGTSQAMYYAENVLKPLVEFSENIWRLEISLRNEELNNCWWRDWRERDFNQKPAYSKKYPAYKFVRDGVKVFAAYMQKPVSYMNRGKLVPMSDKPFEKYLQLMKNTVVPVDYRKSVFVLCSSKRLEEFYNNRVEYKNRSYIDLYENCIDKQVFDNFKWCQRQMNNRRCVLLGCRDPFTIGPMEVYRSYEFDGMMIRRIFKMQSDFVGVLGMINKQKRVNLAHYIQLNKQRYEGKHLVFETKKGLKKEVVLTVELQNALVKYLSMKKARVEIPRQTKYRNELILKAYCDEFHVQNWQNFQLSEIFDLKFAFNEKYKYICPIINNRLNDFFIEEKQFKKMIKF